MKRATLPSPKLNPNFIGSWMMDSIVCDEIITYFENNKDRQKKGSRSGGIDTSFKNSTDMAISPNDVQLPENDFFRNYFKQLHSCYDDYVKQWPFLTGFVKKIDIGYFNIQRYQPGQHFSAVHTERGDLSTLHRLYAWMTYLNDVDLDDGGSTTFTHYELDVQPKKGLTLIWPAEWTHAHKGNEMKANTKYIITGWMHFPV